MDKKTYLLLLFIFLINILSAQSVERAFSQKKMRKDLEVFKEIRQKANSGLYKYRTKEQIDSIYTWAENEIDKSSTYLDFYNIICQLTDFEGSLHNDTDFPSKYWKSLRKETYGYFPYPVKWVDGKWLVNFDNGTIPLGSEIVSINNEKMEIIISNLYKYYTTDGFNTTGKRIGLRTHFSRYYRWHYGLTESFNIEYQEPNSNTTNTKVLKSVASLDYYKNFSTRYSRPFDQIYYADLAENQKYKYEEINASTGILTIYSFSMGNETALEHKQYCHFLDSVFSEIKTKKIGNLIVDVRQNGGGTDPNDLVTYSYLTQRNFKESQEVWISFSKIPDVRFYHSSIPKILRGFGIGKYNRWFQNRFPTEKDGKYFIGKDESEMQVRNPNKNAFTGNIYLLTSPAVASAGSLFAAMVAGNKNTTIIGEETMGGYYGHNGHTPLEYTLPKSKFTVTFSAENIKQDVPEKLNQNYGSGIIPDYNVSQNFEDYLKQEDTQMNFVLKLIEKNVGE